LFSAKPTPWARPRKDSFGIIVLGVSYLLALLGIKKFERMVKE
jgi:hypothetical protein